ncbi:MAG: ATP-binding cassette domain-containing protein, partial [Planctomycetota bacterium]
MASGAEHEAIVDLRGVVRRFGKFTALNGLNMEVPRGVVYGFVGNNGAGKTTTLHAMLGLIPVDAGTLRVLGRETRHAAADLRDRIGFFPERDEPYDWVTVGSLLRFGSL